MFKEVQKIMEDFKVVALKFKQMNDDYHDMEDKRYNTQDEIEDLKAKLEQEHTAKIDKAEKVDEHKCKCCDSVLSKHVTNHAELAKLEKEMWDKIENHPKVKRLEKKMKKEEEEFSNLDTAIDKMADTIYEYEGEIKRALDNIELPDSWISFQTSLV